MTTPTRLLDAPSRRHRHVRRLLGPALVLLVLVMLLVGTASASAAYVRASLALSVAGVIAGVCLLAPHHAVVAAVVWLVGLGLIRRIFLYTGAIGQHDPLLLVQPAIVVVLVFVAASRGAFRERSRLATMVLLLSGLLAVGVINPLQGGIQVGLGGLLFTLVPLLWFWVGRGIVDDTLLRRVLAVIAAAAPVAALYGLYQVYRGFPAWDAAWVESRGYASLQVGRAFRQFASFSAASEYVLFLVVGLLIWLLYMRQPRRLVPGVLVIGVMCWALAVASIRGALVALLFTLGVVIACSRGMGPARTLALGIVGLMLLGLVVTRISPDELGGERTAALLSRTVTGLSDPLDPKSSTLPLYLDALGRGLTEAVQHPYGRGSGAASIAADRFGSTSAITELDPSNVAIAVGIPGVILYVGIVLAGVRLAYERARERRDLLSLAALAILLATGLQWLNGGLYAVAPLAWLALGWLDRPNDQEVEQLPMLPVVHGGGEPPAYGPISPDRTQA